MRGRVCSTISLVALLSACVGEPPVSPTEDADSVAVTSEAVVGGQMSAACGWPSTVDVNGCTGTLIHPRVVTTAAHCLTGTTMKINFTAGKGTSGAFSVTGTCKGGARGSSGGGTGKDWAYCVLPEDPRVSAMPITPPLVGCEADKFLKVGASGWVVGFGTTGSRLNDNGIKREVEVKVNKVGNGIVDIGDKNVGACHGDSGGPIYMHLMDGAHDWGWRVFGSTSSAGGNCDCTCSTIYVDIRQHVKAIEENEKIDVTPCTDADGKWAPTAACTGFMSDPQHATGTYPMCTAALTKEPIASCDGAVPGAGAAGGGAISAGRGGASALGGALAAAGGGAGVGGLAAIGGAGAIAGNAAGGALGLAGGAALPGGLAGRPAGVLPGTAAGSGAAGMPHTAGNIGMIMNPVQAAAGTGATSFSPTPPPAKTGCQAAGARGGAMPSAWAVVSFIGIGFGLRRRQRRASLA